MSRFYNLPKFMQWIIAIMLLIIGTGVLMPLLIKPYALLLLPLLAPLLNLPFIFIMSQNLFFFGIGFANHLMNICQILSFTNLQESVLLS